MALAHVEETQPIDTDRPHIEDKKLPTLTIEWGKTSVAEWQRLLARVPRSNVIQTFAYAQAVRSAKQQMTRFGVIREKGAPVGLVQIQEVKLFGVFHTVVLDRGPLWFAENVSPDYWEAFFKTFDREFPRRIGRWRRIMPELDETEENLKMLISSGLRVVRSGYRSIWLDLRDDTEQIRKRFKGKWRNALNAAEKSGLDVAVDWQMETLPWLLMQYEADKKERGYDGPSASFLHCLTHAARGTGNVIVLRAMKRDRPVAAIMILRHGSSATYQIGWTSDEGRDAKSHHLLLWRACLALKDIGVEWFDAGGINEEHAEGVTRFKRGLGGREYKLVGTFS